MKQKVKQKTSNTIEINKPSKYKTFVVYEHDEFNKKLHIFRTTKVNKYIISISYVIKFMNCIKKIYIKVYILN